MGAFFHFRRAVFSSMLKSRVSSILAKATALLINLNLDGTPITSKSHTQYKSLDPPGYVDKWISWRPSRKRRKKRKGRGNNNIDKEEG
jgi:hypothetical protein